MNGQIFRPARLHQFQFQTAFRRIEAGMEDGAVGLGGAGEDIGAFFDDHHLRTGQRETAGDRATDHTGADDGNVEFRGGGLSHGLPFAFVLQSEINRRDGSRRCSSGVHKRE